MHSKNIHSKVQTKASLPTVDQTIMESSPKKFHVNMYTKWKSKAQMHMQKRPQVDYTTHKPTVEDQIEIRKGKSYTRV